MTSHALMCWKARCGSLSDPPGPGALIDHSFLSVFGRLLDALWPSWDRLGRLFGSPWVTLDAIVQIVCPNIDLWIMLG